MTQRLSATIRRYSGVTWRYPPAKKLNTPTRSRLLLASIFLCSPTSLAQPLELGARARVAYLTDYNQDSSQYGQAANLALRVNWRADWSDLISSLVQADWVDSGWQDQHSDGVRFNGEPRIPDVPGGDLNQVFVRFKSSTQQITLGRQTLEWDDLRFLSPNNFWQNPQSFDALHIDRALADASHIQYAYIHQALRIFGRDADTYLNESDLNFQSQKGLRPKDGLGEHAMHTHALQWQWREWDYTDLTVYGYFINNETAANLSSHTLGARLGYQQKFAAWNYRFLFAAARQKRPQLMQDYDLPYWHVQTSLGRGALEWSLDYEYLGAHKGKALITPLGFTHEYQGWADRFTATPAKGVEDISLRNTHRWGQLRLDMRYHHFFSTQDNDRYGRELDAELGYQFAVNQKIALRMARFWADSEYKNSLKSVQNFYLTGSYQY